MGLSFGFSNNEGDNHISDSNLCFSFESVQTLCDYSALRALNSQKLWKICIAFGLYD